MTGPLPGADATARLDKWAADAKAKAERYKAMSAATQQVAVRDSSPDGLVTVTVDSAGNVTDLRLTDRVRELSGSQVATAILATMRRAQAKLADRIGEVMAATIGDDKQTTDTIMGNYRAKFPEPEPEPEPHEPPATTEQLRIGAPEPAEPGPAMPPMPPPRPRPAPPRPARRAGDDEDDSWADHSYLKRD